MKKDYRIFSVALLLLGIAMNVVAQTTAYVALKERQIPGMKETGLTDVSLLSTLPILLR